jgi:O-antigen/teichoic acid export membrane protein
MVVGAVATSVAPMGTVLLPMASRFIGRGEVDQLKEHSMRFGRWALLLASVASIVIFVVAPQVSLFFIGEFDVAFVRVLRITVVATTPFCYFMCMRHVVDAHYEQPVNTYNIAVGLLTMLTIAGLLSVIAQDFAYVTDVVMISYVLGLTVVALLTHRSVLHVIQPVN